MAKDPAINWYFDNWMGGTKGFNRFQKGCYFDILTLQYYCGPLTLEQIKNELGQDFHSWEFIRRKFKQDECGNYYNERLATEIRKRAEYSESRSKNRKSKSYDTTYVEDMKNTCSNIPGIETETEINTGKGGAGEKPKKFGKPDFRDKLIQLGVQEKYVDAWLEVRVKKRAVFTEVALDAIVTECSKHDFPLAEAIKICAEMGWQGFKHSWLKQNQNNGKSSKRDSQIGKTMEFDQL